MASHTSLTDLTNSINQKATELQSNPHDGKQRMHLLQQARDLVSSLEKPHERIMRMIYYDPALFAATKILFDLNIFKLLTTSKEPLTGSQLAQKTGADSALIERILKLIAVEKFVQETGPDTYAANDLTRSLAENGPQGAIEDMFQSLKVLHGLPEFLKETKYRNPEDKDHSAWMYSYETDQHYFEYINTPGREQNLEAFGRHMSFKTVGLKWFEVPEIVDAAFGKEGMEGEGDEVLVVDVGGSDGHDLLAFHHVHGGVEGRLILQDTPATIQSLNVDDLKEQGIEAMAHDFFTPQPIIGAKVYYLKMVLHDWPTVQCVKILEQLREGMEKGYSKILLNEIVIPETGAGWFETSVDFLMMHVHSAQERRGREWRELVESVEGLRLVKVWDVEGAVEKVIEIEAV